jgi:hypothetical protein
MVNEKFKVQEKAGTRLLVLLTAFALILMLAFTLAACGGSAAPNGGNSAPASQESPAQTTEPESISMSEEEMLNTAQQITFEALYEDISRNKARAESYVGSIYKITSFVYSVEVDYCSIGNSQLQLRAFLPKDTLMVLNTGDRITVVGEISEMGSETSTISGTSNETQYYVMENVYKTIESLSPDELKDIREKNSFAQGKISANSKYAVGVKPDGSVIVFAADEYIAGAMPDGSPVIGKTNIEQLNLNDVAAWTDIVAVVAGGTYTVGLKSDGTVVAAGDNTTGQCDVLDWRDIVMVASTGSDTVGLKKDGTVISVGWDSSRGIFDGISNWNDIVSISASAFLSCIVGLKADGTVVAVGDNYQAFEAAASKIAEWSNIVAVAAGRNTIVGLKADGYVVVAGNAFLYNDAAPNWVDVVAVSASDYGVALKADGTVFATEYVETGSNYVKGYDVSSFKDIVAISTAESFFIGLRADGTVVTAVQYKEVDSEMSELSTWDLW